MAIALHGNLRDFGIAEVFQLIGQQRKTGTLVVGEESEGVFLSFDEGRVVTGGAVDSESEGGALGRQLVRSGYLTREQLHDVVRESARSARPIPDLLVASGRLEASDLDEVRELLTRETVFDIMRRKTGQFRFTAESILHDLPTDRLLGAEQILMDGLRMLDEWQTFSATVPSEDTIFRRVGSLEDSRAIAAGASDARLRQVDRVLGLVDGRLSVRRVVDLSRIGTFEATRVLAELRQAGLIDVAGEAVRRVPQRRAKPVSLLPIVRAVAASIVPFAALGLIAARLQGSAESGTDRVGTAIPDRSLARVGSASEVERIRQLLEVHAYLHGRYPERLDELSAVAGEAGISLTPARLAAYYYVARNDEVVLLPPMD